MSVFIRHLRVGDWFLSCHALRLCLVVQVCILQLPCKLMLHALNEDMPQLVGCILLSSRLELGLPEVGLLGLVGTSEPR